MIINQISIFLENKSGRLHEVFEILSNNNINVSACSIADTSDFGILRLIVSDPILARTILKEKSFSVNINEVISVAAPNKPGALSKILGILSDVNNSVEYLYGFSIGDKSFFVLKSEDPQKAAIELKKNETELLDANDLYNSGK